MFSKLTVMVVTLSALVGFTSCKTSTDPNDEPRLELQAEMSSNTVTAGSKSVKTQGRFIDSIKIQRTRVLLSRIKLHTADDKEDNDKGKDVKIGPAVIDFQRGKISTVFFATPIPVGKYEKIKLEMHKFNSSEASMYAGHSEFGPFAAPEKVTLIVDGTLWVNGVAEDFTWTDDETSNLWIKFDPFIEVLSSTTSTVVLNFDPVLAFRTGGGGGLLDPKDHDIKSSIRSRLWGAFWVRRK